MANSCKNIQKTSTFSNENTPKEANIVFIDYNKIYIVSKPLLF